MDTPSWGSVLGGSWPNGFSEIWASSNMQLLHLLELHTVHCCHAVGEGVETIEDYTECVMVRRSRIGTHHLHSYSIHQSQSHGLRRCKGSCGMQCSCVSRREKTADSLLQGRGQCLTLRENVLFLVLWPWEGHSLSFSSSCKTRECTSVVQTMSSGTLDFKTGVLEGVVWWSQLVLASNMDC